MAQAYLIDALFEFERPLSEKVFAAESEEALSKPVSQCQIVFKGHIRVVLCQGRALD
jgi:hypothetical protein